RAHLPASVRDIAGDGSRAGERTAVEGDAAGGVESPAGQDCVARRLGVTGRGQKPGRRDGHRAGIGAAHVQAERAALQVNDAAVVENRAAARDTVAAGPGTLDERPLVVERGGEAAAV